MNIQEGLPLHTAPADHFRYGFESMEAAMAQSNPVMVFEKNVSANAQPPYHEFSSYDVYLTA